MCLGSLPGIIKILGLVLGVLKVLGIVLLCILGFILFVLLLLLFVPLRVKADGTFLEEEKSAKAYIYWLFHIVHGSVVFKDKQLNIKVRVFGIPVFKMTKPDEDDSNDFEEGILKEVDGSSKVDVQKEVDDFKNVDVSKIDDDFNDVDASKDIDDLNIVDASKDIDDFKNVDVSKIDDDFNGVEDDKSLDRKEGLKKLFGKNKDNILNDSNDAEEESILGKVLNKFFAGFDKALNGFFKTFDIFLHGSFKAFDYILMAVFKVIIGLLNLVGLILRWEEKLTIPEINTLDLVEKKVERAVETGGKIKDKIHETDEKIHKIKFKIVGFKGKIKSISFKIKDIRKKTDKVKFKVNNTKDRISDYKALARTKRFKKTFAFAKKELFKLLKHYFPRKVKGYVNFGFEEPDKTGRIYGFICIAYGLFKKRLKKIYVNPDFNRKVLEGELHIKGHIRLIWAAILAIKVLLNRNIWILKKKFDKINKKYKENEDDSMEYEEALGA